MKCRQLAIISIFFSFYFVGFGQGMTIYSGTSSMKSDLLSLTAKNKSHTGYLVGADGRLGDDSFYFMIGLQYHQLNFFPTQKFSLKVNNPSIDIIKGRGGLAFRIWEVSKEIQVRIRLMGSVDYFLKIPLAVSDDNPSNLEFNEGVGGAVGGFEFDIYFLTLNLEYQRGFFNSVKNTEGSSMHYFTTSLGINF